MVGVPTLVVGALRLVPDDRVDRCSRSRTGTGSAASARPSGSARRTTARSRRSTRRSGRRSSTTSIWLGFLTLVATPFGLLLAYQLDKNIRGTRIYQSIFFLPVVLVARDHRLHLAADLLADPGPDQQPDRQPAHGHVIDWLGNPQLNLWAVLVAVGWRHAGYIMILYLAGLKAVDPSLREAAAIDGAGEWHAFRTVVFPALRPINIVDRRRHGDRGAARVRHRLHHQQRPERPRAPLGARHRQHHRRGEPHRLRLGDRRDPDHDLDHPDHRLRLEHLPGGEA